MADWQTDSEGKVLLKSLTYSQMEEWVAEIGEKKFRTKQLWSWLYTKYAASFDEMTNLSKSFRTRLAETARVDAIECTGVHQATDGTRKMTWKTLSGGEVETVLIPTESRNTLCISSQVGCAINCQFCLTAKMGLRAQLTTAEIVDQVVQVRRRFEDEKHVSNVVFMGMGEPLHNPDNVIPATNILIDRLGLDFSRRKVTVSTSGLIPQIIRLGNESGARLAVSLNATTNEVRDWIMPINRRYPLEDLMEALRSFRMGKGERITFEYVMLKGVNDSDDDARRIVKLTSKIPAKINLIPFNTHPGTEFESSTPERVDAFREILASKNVFASIRQTRGDDRMAACGQLGVPGPKMPKRMPAPERFKESLGS